MIDPGLFSEEDRPSTGSSVRQIFEHGPLTLKRGGQIPNAVTTFQTWGNLNEAKDNVIWVCHAISGDSNAAGWWPRFVGAGKPLDTDRYFVVCCNVIGGCQGSTGPAGFGATFPFVTVEDMVHAQRQVMDSLGIQEIQLVCGGSMGGMQALEWSRQEPHRVQRVWATASAGTHSAMQIGFNEVARQCIIRDPKWLGGNYGPDDPPAEGLALARMLGHLTYLSPEAFEAKFGRELQTEGVVVPRQDAEFAQREVFQVENYLAHQGQKFVARFDANTFIVVSNAIDAYRFEPVASGSTRFLLTSFSTDWLYPPVQSESLAAELTAAGCECRHVNIDSKMGHDAFLLDDQEQARIVREFLAD